MSSIQFRAALLAALLATANAATTKSNLRKLQDTNSQVPIGFQSGPDPGASYGGSIVYRPDTNRIYVTGATYGNFFKAEDALDSNGNAARQPSCFLGIAEIPPVETSLAWVHARQWETSVPEACNAIYVDQNPVNLPENNTRVKEKMYLLGITSTTGTMEPLRIESTFPAQQYGMIMDVDILLTEPDSNEFTTTFWGGRLLQDGPVQYPIDLTLDDEGNLYVASLQTFDSSQTTKTTRLDQVAKQMVNPHMTPYGSEYNMLLQQFLYDNPGYDDGIGIPEDPDNVPIDTTIVDNWRKPYGPTNGSGGALVAGIEYLGGLLIVVGSTNGHSQVFGNEIWTNQNHTDTSWDGFVTKIIPDSGTYYQFVADNGAPKDGTTQPLHKRSATGFSSIDFKDDYIMGMCTSPADTDHFYLVGTTEGQMSPGYDPLIEGEVHAFLMRVDLYSMLPTWIKQIGGSAARKDVVKGMVCTVTEDGKDIYMAGVVENGGSLADYDQESFGQDDVFLFQANAEDGELVFLRQIGTSGNDRLSPGGLTTDEFGNAILMGQTDGSFYRSRQFDQESEKSEDLFIMTVMRGTGDYKEPQLPDTAETTPTESDVNAGSPFPNEEEEEPKAEPEEAEPEDEPPTEATPEVEQPAATVQEPAPVEELEPPTEPEPATPEKPDEDSEDPDVFSPDSPDETLVPKPIGSQPEIYQAGAVMDHENPHLHNSESTKQPNRQRYGLVIFFILVAIVGLIAGLFAYRQMSRGESSTDRDAVLGYLNDFDVDDIDLKQSATGGYHCSYTNDLAHGINAKAATREGLFGPMGFSSKSGTNEDPLLAVHPRDPRAGGEISFTDEPSATDDISSIGSGIATQGRHSTHNEALLDDYDGSNQTKQDLVI